MTTTNFKLVQAQSFSLSGAGATATSTNVILKSFAQIDGTLLTMTNFGTIGFGTIEPGNGTLEEQISFTGVTQNANGTATLTGVSTVLMVSPYTQTSGLAQTHAGSTTFVITNTSGFYDQFVAKNDDAVVTGLVQFPNDANTPILGTSYVAPTLQYQVASKGYADSLAIAGAPNATTSVQGLVQLPTQTQVDAGTATGSTGASLTPTPALLRSKLLSDYVIDTGAADAYVITPAPAIAAYATGQIFTFKSIHTNTTASTLNVNGKGATAIKKYGTVALVAGDIVSGTIYMVEYDGTNFQLLSDTSEVKMGQSSQEVYAADSVGTDAYAITLVPAITGYVTGQVFNFKAGTANTGAATLAVNGLTAITIKKQSSSDLTTGDIVVGQIVNVIYDGTNFQMQSQRAQGFIGKYSSGVSNRDMSTASGAQNIAHGLGVIPTSFTVQGMFYNTNSSGEALSFNGNSIYGYQNSGGGANAEGAFVITLNGTDKQTAVITADATNIILTWTKAGTPTGSVSLLWQAFA